MSMRRVHLSFALFCLASSLLGCIGNEAVVFVEPSITAPEASVSATFFGVTVNGSFKLVLSLGPRASGPSTVELGSVAMTDADNKQSVVPSLSLISDKAPPFTVQPDSEVTIGMIFDTNGKVLPDETKTTLCAPAGVHIAGTIKDSLEDAVTPFASSAFKPTGCM